MIYLDIAHPEDARMIREAAGERWAAEARRSVELSGYDHEARERCAQLDCPDADLRLMLHIKGEITTAEIDLNIAQLARDMRCGVQPGWDICFGREEVTEVFATFTGAAERWPN